MRKVALSIFVLLVTFASAQAQHPSAEVFGGFSYMNTDLTERENFYGWGISAAWNVNRHIGFVADVSGNYGKVRVPPRTIGTIFTIPGFDQEASYHTFLFGPRISSRGNRATLFGQALIGGVKKNALSERRLNIEIPGFPLPPIFPGIPDISNLIPDARLSSGTGFAVSIGGGVDISASKGVAVRLFQVDYQPARLNDRWESNVRLQAGIVFRFGGD